MAYGHAKTQTLKRHLKGFTIVELLIVVVVIAILAAITIVAFNGIQNRAKASSAQSAVQQSAKKIIAFTVDNAENYPTASGANGIANLAVLGISNNGNTTYQYSSNNTVSPRTFCLTATSGNVSYYISQSTTKPTAGACAGHGANGAVAITNYHPNPGAVNASGQGYGSWPGNSGNTAVSSVVAAPWAASGSAFRVTWTGVPSPDSGDISVRFDTGQIQPDTKYTVVYKLKGPNRSSWVTSQAMYAATAGSWTTYDKFPTTTQSLTANQVVERWITFSGTAAALSSGLRAPQSLTSKVVNDTLEVSEAIIYEGDYVPGRQWAWGNSAGWAWTGTANDSTSTGPSL